MQRGGIGAAVDRCYAAQDILLFDLGILDIDIEVAPLIETLSQDIDQFELQALSAPLFWLAVTRVSYG